MKESSMKEGPISPQEAEKRKERLVPAGVFSSFNDCISANYFDGRARFEQDTVVALIMNRCAVSRAKVFERRWLDVECFYEEVGWKVEYSKPGIGEDFKAFFVFRAPK